MGRKCLVFRERNEMLVRSRTVRVRLLRDEKMKHETQALICYYSLG